MSVEAVTKEILPFHEVDRTKEYVFLSVTDKEGIVGPEKKRKIIGNLYVGLFEREDKNS